MTHLDEGNLLDLLVAPYFVIVEPSKDDLRNMKSHPKMTHLDKGNLLDFFFSFSFFQLWLLGFLPLLHLLWCGGMVCIVATHHTLVGGWWRFFQEDLLVSRGFHFSRWLFKLLLLLFSLCFPSFCSASYPLSFNFPISQVRRFYLLFSSFEKFISSFLLDGWSLWN